MEIKKATEPVAYEDALRFMEERVAGIHAGAEDEMIWLLEHPPLYTAGTSAKAGDLLDTRFPVYQTGRGGQYTYHGPGQRVSYVMVNLRKYQQHPDIKQYIWNLEEWIIRALAHFYVKGERRDGRVGIWVADGMAESKIAAIGVRVRRWVTYHGISINVDPDLSHYAGIVPCGIREHGVTSLARLLGCPVAMEEIDDALKAESGAVFDAARKAA
ncbi:MAG: lipoyl(octanoyl) transferase LipB [Proteobacteria bacterium]|nr:lipoyl(octanoyl) transferase LipB [Pseudomonadota bacterium]